jgi:hypothetical protein
VKRDGSKICDCCEDELRLKEKREKVEEIPEKDRLLY